MGLEEVTHGVRSQVTDAGCLGNVGQLLINIVGASDLCEHLQWHRNVSSGTGTLAAAQERWELHRNIGSGTGTVTVARKQ